MHELSIGTKIGDLEWRNGPYFALFHQIFVYDVIVKQLGLPRDQNLLIFCDHINTIWAIIQRLFWQNKICLQCFDTIGWATGRAFGL